MMPHFSSDPTATPPIFPNLEKSPQIVMQRVAKTKEARGETKTASAAEEATFRP